MSTVQYIGGIRLRLSALERKFKILNTRIWPQALELKLFTSMQAYEATLPRSRMYCAVTMDTCVSG